MTSDAPASAAAPPAVPPAARAAAPADDLVAAIARAVEDGWDDQLAVLDGLVRIPSLRGQSAPAVDYMARAFRERGYPVDHWTLDLDQMRHHPGYSPMTVPAETATCCVASLRPTRETGRSLVLNGHVDVVPSGPVDMWATPPFEPVVRDGWMYGRGAGDMKAGVVANLAALQALKRLGHRPAGTVHMEVVSEEESTGNGALACWLRGYTGDAALISEPTGGRLTRANLGVVWFQIRVRGRPVHASTASTGANAIDAAYRLVGALRGLEAEWNADRVNHRYFEGTTHPINFNLGQIRGGEWNSSVPAWCTLDMRAAYYPGVSTEDAQRQIEACIRAASRDDPYLSNNPPELSWTGFTTNGYVLEPGSEAEAVLTGAHAAASGGSALGSQVSQAYLDARVFAEFAGIPALNYGPTAENVHGIDERVDLDSVKRTTCAIALFIAQWCGLEPAA